ncbi:efflux RND transporter periplasmic adaptor subunit, partial [bacterium]|nr:efflux RND transporter periplasmic adaptor subunit [bacterium]
QVQARRAALENMLLKSPVAGTVIRTFVEPGELCRKGESCILITDDSRGRWIEGYIREDDAGLVSVGQRAMVEVVVGSGRSFEAEVSQIGLSTSSLDGADGGRVTMSELVWVKMRPTNMEGKFLPGMSAQATIRVR